MQSNWIILNKKQLNRAQWKPNQMLSGTQGVQGTLHLEIQLPKMCGGGSRVIFYLVVERFPTITVSFRMLWSLTGESVPWEDWRQSEEIRIVQSLESPSLSSVVPWRRKTSCACAYVTGTAFTRNKMAAMIDVKWKKIVFRNLYIHSINFRLT